jgi:hypothetical protein
VAEARNPLKRQGIRLPRPPHPAAPREQEAAIQDRCHRQELEQPVFLAARTGAEEKAKELSAKNGIQIEVIGSTPPTEDGQVQAQRIQQAVNDGADAILISCSDAGKVTGAINDAGRSRSTCHDLRQRRPHNRSGSRTMAWTT